MVQKADMERSPDTKGHHNKCIYKWSNFSAYDIFDLSSTRALFVCSFVHVKKCHLM